VIIWNYTAEKVLDHPILGVGTNSTRYLDEARTLQEKMKPNDGVAAAATRAHPHNIYLQIWYELGAVGVLAFGILGVSLLLRTALLPETAVAFGLAHFALCMAALAPAYGLWQNWFQSALVLSILALLAVSVAPRADPSRGCDAS
jgi:O-antigen ligase